MIPCSLYTLDVILYGDGIDAFEVSDNGHGIGLVDLKLLGQPHCTSKLKNFDDLDVLDSLGFRGEAFHSLCSLSRSVTLTSRVKESEIGYQAQYTDKGIKNDPRPCASSVGCKVHVEGLFHQYAVRLTDWRKNTKKVISRVLKIVQSYAVGFPSIKFRLTNQSQSILVTSGCGSSVSILSELFGIHAKSLKTFSGEPEDSVTVSCIASVPEGPKRSTSDRIFFFVNHHPSDQKLLQKACLEVYREHGFQEFPCLIVHLNLNASQIDVNLTPDKRTITVFQDKLIAQALRDALITNVFSTISLNSKIDQSSQIVMTSYTQQVSESSVELAADAISEPTSLQLEQSKSQVETVACDDLEQSESPSACCELEQSKNPDILETCKLPVISDLVSDNLRKEDFLDMQVIGQFNCGFILTRLDRENTSFMYIVDQHAADERFRLETLEKTQKIQTQPLLKPKCLILPADDLLYLQSHLDQLERVGFVVSVDENDQCSLVSVPQVAGLTLGITELLEVVHHLKEHQFISSSHALSCCNAVATTLASKACRSAIMIGAPLSNAQMSAIVRNLSTMNKPWICAHGRPTVRLLYSTSR